MPRRARLKLPGVTVHVIQRGNNRQACFYADEDFQIYLHHLEELSRQFDCAVHAYALMTNHVHLLVTPKGEDGVSLLMKHLGQRYVQYINRSYGRSGTLWEGRFRSCLTQSEEYLLGCYRYIELNPVRAVMVTHPREYKWSSYRSNAEGKASSLLTAHLLYQRLGHDEEERKLAYRALFKTGLDADIIETIRQATNGGFAIGNARFIKEVEEVLGRRAQRGKAGRPVKVTEEIDLRQESFL
jgi:putative transposase